MIYTGKMNEDPFEGETVTIRGQEFVVPELTLKNRRKWEKELAPFFKTDSVPVMGTDEYDKFQQVVDKVVLAALQQNYPEFSQTLLVENCTGAQLNRLFAIALGRQEADGAGRPT